MSVLTEIKDAGLNAARSKPSTRFLFVDGLRGLCALFVLEHHIFYEIFESKQWTLIEPSRQVVTLWLRHGYISVAGFIVLSGFCLMLPVVVSNSSGLSGGIKSFLARRARRILPPYYAALIISLLLLVVVPGMKKVAGYHWDWSLPALKTNVILSHLLLVHNLNPNWLTKINHPLWSIAIEWQIYFVFALLLMPIRRRFSLAVAVGAALLLGAIPGMVFHCADWTRPWYLGLFALGMVAATISRSSHKTALTLKEKLPWSLITIGFAAGEVCCARAGLDPVTNEVMTALTLMSCLIWGARFSSERATMIGKGVMGVLASKPLVSVGIFSYSLYLIHAPVIALVRMGLVSLKLSPTLTYELLFLLGTVFSIASGYGLFLLVERRFLLSKFH